MVFFYLNKTYTILLIGKRDILIHIINKLFALFSVVVSLQALFLAVDLGMHPLGFEVVRKFGV